MNTTLHLAARGALLLALLGSGAAHAACHVRAGAAGANDGATWADAYVDLQSALRDAACGEVWVAAGTYTPGAARGDSFAVRPGSAVYGGFAGDESVREARDPLAHATVLSGDIGAPGDAADNSWHVVTLDGTAAADAITASTVLDGFTIRDGNANGPFPATLGGGLYCTGAAAGRRCDPTLARLRFVANMAAYGGAMALRADGAGSASPALSDVVFDGNLATRYGGAIYVWAELNGVASPGIERATFNGNRADKGGAIYNSSGGQGGTADASLVNVTFSGNDASLGTSIGNGGAIYNAGVGGSSAMTLTNVTFSGNTANGANHLGGAMVNEGVGATPRIVNAIFWGDQANALPEFHNTVGAQPAISHSIVQGGCPAGATCTDVQDVDPRLGALGEHGGFGATLLPDAAGPAIDTGDAAACPATDQRGVARPQGGGCDLGAVEIVPPHRCYVDRSATGANEGLGWASAYTDLQSALREPLCEEVWVAKGVYKPTAGTDRAISFAIRPGLAVYGGFAGGESAREQADPGAHRTVLSGDIDGNDAVDADGVVRDAEQIAGGNTYNVVVMDGTGAAGPIGNDTVLDGFAITGGTGWQYPIYNGSVAGGLYCNGVGHDDGHACSPTLSRLWFSGNSADWGAALMVDGGNGTGGDGGRADPILSRSTFSGNRARWGGGAAYLTASALSIRQSTFAGNRATNGVAGAIQIERGQPDLDQVTFTGNAAATTAGAIFARNTAASLRRLILWGDSGPGGEISSSGGSVTLSDSVVQGGCPANATCSGVVSADPQLGPLQDNGGAAPTLLPGIGGSALDAGDPAACGAAPYDADQRGVARPQGAACDLGAVELRQAQFVVALDGPGSVAAAATGGTLPASGGIEGCDENGDGCIAGYATEPSAAIVVLDLSPAAHAHLDSVSDTCGADGASIGVLDGLTYTIAALDADCAVLAVFAPDARTVGGSVGGLAGSGLQLQINGGQTLAIAADGAFVFPTALPFGAAYEVAVAAQPEQPWQTCTVADGSGTIGDADVTDVAVTCTTDAHTIGGVVDGVAGDGLVLQLDGGETLPIAADGAFVFATPVPSGNAYAVSVAGAPAGQGCTVERGSGTVAGSDVTDVAVHCAALPPQLVLTIDDGRAFARYGQVVDYTVSLRNDGFGTAADVALDASLSAAFDAAYAHWQCFGGDGGASCAASGEGPLSDRVTLPPGRSLTWRVSVPVRFDSDESEVSFALALGGAAPQNVSDTNVLVLLRDGFDVPYGDGTQIAGAEAEALLGGEATHAFVLPPASGERLDDVMVVRGGSTQLRVQRTPLDARTSLLRLLHRDALGRERVTPWIASADGATCALAHVRTQEADAWLLEAAQASATLRPDGS
ncbi:choice-of-anchor Q domain-containing protein [Dokdonella ginsengisoli]|uniref:Choice-of-anchor Q domain-containing protein n=1 Tax=Dokdonella ginsengisoli TaxID=363846 RepID=A0ABV9QS25_9GAMM